MDIKGVRGHRAIKPQLVGRRIPVTGNEIVMGYTDNRFPAQPHWIVIAINIFAVFNIASQRDQVAERDVRPATGSAWNASHPDARSAGHFERIGEKDHIRI